jgi:hypothetical protein
MTVFISSLIGGMQPFRQGARSGVNTLRHQPIMAEDFCALGAISADRLPCRYPSVRMMAVGKSSGDENPCRKTEKRAFPE